MLLSRVHAARVCRQHMAPLLRVRQVSSVGLTHPVVLYAMSLVARGRVRRSAAAAVYTAIVAWWAEGVGVGDRHGRTHVQPGKKAQALQLGQQGM